MQTPELRVVEARPLSYLLSVPDEPIADRLLPVLCFLHGYDEAAPQPIRRGVTRHGPLRPGSAAIATTQFIVLAPQLPRAGDHWHRFAEAVHELVVATTRQYAGDPARTYLTGFSFGGNGVLDLAISQPDVWAALWAVDPTRAPASDPQRPIWLSVGEAARWRMPSFIRTLSLQSAKEVTEGDRIYLDEGADHVGSAARAYADARIYYWLLARALR
jgi:predicted peptidase